ncbi:MAG: hypothetical protein K2J73_12980 [Oscillospiraceae bacterium]|nr:hypothetical protein [Oscillospiraceae bacterium]
MTAFDIYSALGNVSEELLEESELPVPKAKPKGILYMAAAAACFAVFAAGLHFAFNDSGIAAPEYVDLLTVGSTYSAPEFTQYTCVPPMETTHSVPLYIGTNSETVPADTVFTDEPFPFVSETTLSEADTTANLTEMIQEEEIAIVPRWEDMSDFDRYIYLQYNENEYSITMDKFDKSELTFLQNGELYGIDEYTDKRYSMPCAFYKIKNISENYMIAAPTADGNYTAFINSRYRPDSLGSYLEDIDFSNRCKLTTIKSETNDLVDDEVFSRYFEYDLPDLQQAVEKLLAENSDAVPEINPPPVMDRYFIICGDDTFPTLRISDGGYIGVLGKYFKIGEDKTESFMEYIEENSVKTEYDPHVVADSNDLMIPE